VSPCAGKHRFRQELEPAQQQQTEMIGKHLLKGLEGLQPVFRWTGPGV
jgi:hypothetical protein